MLREQLDDVRQRIQTACRRAGRDPSAVTLIGVTKTVPASVIQAAADLGLADVGENRVQEAEQKQAALGSRLKALGKGVGLQPTASSLQPVRWHLIGHLQRNKARRAVELFDVIHSVDSVELIRDLERHASAAGKIVPVLIQVNVSGEAAKSGCRPDEAAAIAEAVKAASHLPLAGLMTMAPYADDPQAARPHFRSLRVLRDALGPQLKLSMGMSGDFEAAIEEGADFVRIGTAIFGTRT